MNQAVITDNLKKHVKVLADDIGSRSLAEPASLSRTQTYIEEQFVSLGYSVSVQPFELYGVETANIIAYLDGFNPEHPIHLLGAHYDTVTGTPGADDNASAVAVLLECARLVAEDGTRGINTLFTAFSAEEPPAFGTSLMGSRVFVRSLKESGWNIDGALVLEMVGYYTDKPKSQKIPFFLKLKGFRQQVISFPSSAAENPKSWYRRLFRQWSALERDCRWRTSLCLVQDTSF
ncbi:MAG: M28 family peptidase, partial [bacterium]